jgi:hypothetical protein
MSAGLVLGFFVVVVFPICPSREKVMQNCIFLPSGVGGTGQLSERGSQALF